MRLKLVFFFLATLSEVNSLKQTHNFSKLQLGTKTHIYNTKQLIETSAISLRHYGVAVLPSPIGSISQTYDFDPVLLGGFRGYPGIKARINLRAFQYFSKILGPILVQQIKRARIPNINQCIPQVSGCIQVYNIYVSRFRCPQRVILYPEAPNLISVAIENFDIGVTGNLGGQINILVPIALFGIVQMNAHQVSVQVSLVVNRNPSGGVSIQLHRCYTTVGYVDAYVENGGLVGDIANSQFRGKISEMVRSSLPSKICEQLPSVINEQLNSKAKSIPQSISLTQLLQSAINAFNLNNLLGSASGAAGCTATCKTKKLAAQALHGVILSPLKDSTQSHLSLQNSYYKIVNSRHVKSSVTQPKHQLVANKNKKPDQYNIFNRGTALPRVNHQQQQHKVIYHPNDIAITKINEKRTRRQAYAINQRYYIGNNYAPSAIASGIPTNKKYVGSVASYNTPISKPSINAVPKSYIPPIISTLPPSDLGIQPNQLIFVSPGTSSCNLCPNTNAESDSTLSILSVILQSLDFNKLSNIFLTVQLLQSYATSNDYTIDLNGEFSLNGRGGTPFGAFPINFPHSFGHKMAEILISDWTVNSLVGFLTFKITPETPKIGDLLKTTCSSDDDEGLEDHGVEEEDNENNSTVLKKTQRDVKTRVLVSPIDSILKRVRRQDDNALASLGICFGDILPVVREKYPNQKIVVIIQSSRAPFILLSAKNGGIATVDFVLNANFYIQSTNEKVGTIEVASTIDFLVHTTNNRISGHANITQLRLRDISNSLGLPQDALDNLGNLGKELLLKATNNALEKGAPLKIPPNLGGLPLTFINPEIAVIEHALHLSSDFTIDPSAIAQLSSSSGSGC